MRKTTTVALTTVVALLATGGVATAVATTDEGTSPASAQTDQASQADAKKKRHAPKTDGARKLCKRAPKIDKRIDRVLKRLDADATRRGSVDRLEKRIENAKKAGHGTIEDFLNERLKDRRALKPRLEDRQEDLAKVRAWCAKEKKERKDEKESKGSES